MRVFKFVLLFIILISIDTYGQKYYHIEKAIIPRSGINKGRYFYELHLSERDKKKFKINRFADSLVINKNYVDTTTGKISEKLAESYLSKGQLPLDYKRGYIQDSAGFNSITFVEPLEHNGSITYRNSLNFLTVFFKGKVNFDRSIFIKSPQFYNCKFDSTFLMENCVFEADVSFNENKFARFSTARNTTFGLGEPVSFSGSVFNGRADFSNTDFGNSVSFRGAQFAYPPIFNLTTLPDTLDFRGISFNDKDYVSSNSKIDFRNAYANRKCLLYIKGTDASRLILPYDKFELYYSWDSDEKNPY